MSNAEPRFGFRPPAAHRRHWRQRLRQAALVLATPTALALLAPSSASSHPPNISGASGPPGWASWHSGNDGANVASGSQDAANSAPSQGPRHLPPGLVAGSQVQQHLLQILQLVQAHGGGKPPSRDSAGNHPGPAVISSGQSPSAPIATTATAPTPAPAPPPKPTGSQPASSSPASSAPAASSAATPAHVATPVPSPAAPAPTAASLAPASIPARPPAAHRRPHRSRLHRHHRVSGPRRTASGQRRLAEVAPTVVARRPSGPAPARRRPSAPARQRHGTPLTTTVVRHITQVIRVIPKPVRIALGALAALGLLFAAATGLLALRTRRLLGQRRRLAADVGLLEATLLPSVPERVGLASVSTAFRPAESLAAGGDFYDAFALPDGRTCVVVGDVEGHGSGSISRTALVRYRLRAYLEAGLSPRTALQVASGGPGSELDEQLVTAVAAVFDAHTGLLTYACAGHPPPVVLGAEHRSPAICSSPPLGAGLPTGRREVTLPLAPSGAALVYTDGVVDPRIAGGRFGPARLAVALGAQGPRGTATELLDQVLGHSVEQTDDMVACILRSAGSVEPDRRFFLEELEVDRDLLERWGERFLAACGAGEDEIGAALWLAANMIERSGTAVFMVRGEAGKVTVAVCGPAPAAFATSAPLATA